MYCTVLYCTVLYCSEGIEEPARFRPELHQHPAGGGGLRRHALHQPRGSQPHKLQETFRDILKLKKYNAPVLRIRIHLIWPDSESTSGNVDPDTGSKTS